LLCRASKKDVDARDRRQVYAVCENADMLCPGMTTVFGLDIAEL
jgi:hypothetical protein